MQRRRQDLRAQAQTERRAARQARAIQEDLHDPATEHMSLAPGPKTVLSYRVRDEAGTVSFSDTSAGQPAVFRQLALFVLRAAQQVCQLPE